MSGRRAEARKSVYVSVAVSCEGENGPLQDAPARMEDRSLSGACIRALTPVRVGSKVRIRSLREEFSGIARYCRRDGGEYVFGIQRITKEHVHASSDIKDPKRESATKQLEENSNQKTEASPNPRVLPTKTSAQDLAEGPNEVAGQGTATKRLSQVLHPPGFEAPTGAVLQTQQLSQFKERIEMSTKWLNMALGRQKQEAPNGRTNGTSVEVNAAPAEHPPADKVHVNPDRKILPRYQGDLQSMEDVYRAAGIVNPRMGYSIGKVVEMLSSEHVRGLSSDVKRAAVLMALDAAGVSIDEVLRDARQRQDALSAYEADQRKQFEEYWARKDEVNTQIQMEMDRVMAQSLDRIKRNLDEVATEKGAFARWQAMKQQEAERMAEALALCSKPSPSEASTGTLMSLRGVDHTLKPS